MRFLIGLLSLGCLPGHFIEALRVRSSVRAKPAPHPRSSLPDEALTAWERSRLERDRALCFDCLYGDLVTVAHDDTHVTVRCSLCPTKLRLARTVGPINGYRLHSFPLEAATRPSPDPARPAFN